MRIASLELIGSGTPSSRSPMTSTPPQRRRAWATAWSRWSPRRA